MGSANFNFMSMTQLSETGVLVTHCPQLAGEASNIFNAYWTLAKENKAIQNWPAELHARIGLENPLLVKNLKDGTIFRAYFASSPGATASRLLVQLIFEISHFKLKHVNSTCFSSYWTSWQNR